MSEKEVKKGKEKLVKIPLKFKSIVFVVAMISLTMTIMICVAMPAISNSMKEIVEGYMFDVAESSGQLLDVEVSSRGDKAALESERLEEHFKDVKLEGVESSYVYVVSPNGTMLYHPTAEKIGKPVENEVITKVVEEIKSGKVPKPAVVTYEFKGSMKYAGYYVNDNANYILVVSADEADIMDSVSYVGKVMGVSGGIASVIGLVLVFFVFSYLFGPLRKIAELVSRMGQLNFAKTPELEKLCKSSDETGLMARAVNNVQDQLATVVVELKNSSEALYQSSDNLSGNAAVTAETIEQINHAVHDMAEGASSQAVDTQTATESVILIGNMVEEANKEVSKLRKNVQVMHESGEEAVKTLKELEEINAEAKGSIEQIYQQTNTTNESAMKIKDAIALITSIAEETNLLSLNASIEAARAGEQGKGFAVVASQIQKLAEQSNESAMKVQEIVDMLMEDSAKAVDTMDKVKVIMDSQMQKVDVTGNMFTKVQEEIERSMDGITKIHSETEKMDEARINVVDVVQNLTAIAEENAAGTEETSASVTEVSTIVEDISGNAKQLHDVAQTIDEHMKEFTV